MKVILNSHAHYDHCGGFAELKRRTGARIVDTEADAPDGAGRPRRLRVGDDYPFEPITPTSASRTEREYGSET